MANVSVNINTSRLVAIMAQVGVNADQVNHDLAEQTGEFIRGSWSGYFPPASAPGDPPAIRTGYLDSSVTVEPIPGGWVVYIEAFYGIFLELGTIKMSPRPFFISAIWNVVSNYGDLFKDVFVK